MSLFSLLDPRLWIALGLALAVSFGAGFWKGNAHGKSTVRAEWIAATATANQEARALEQARQRRADEAAKLGAAREARIRADAASAARAASRMRSTLDATERAAKESADASARVVSALRAVFESCIEEYRALGQEAAGHASDSLKLQEAWPK